MSLKNSLFSFFNKSEKKQKDTIADHASEKVTPDFETKLSNYEKDYLYSRSIQKTAKDLCIINPNNGKKTGQDSAFSNDQGINPYGNINYNANDIIYSYFSNFGFIGYNACAILKQHWAVNIACTVAACDAIRPDYQLVLLQEDEKVDVDENKIREIKLLSRTKYKINDICKNLVINKKVFGSAMAMPLVDGIDYEAPFNIDGVKKGSYRGFVLLEPFWIVPELDYEDTFDPASGHFYEPTWWRLSDGKRIHRSHLIRVINASVPDILKPTYYFGGVPLTQMIYERVYAAERVANEAPLMALTKRLLVADANLEEFVANQREAQKTLEAISWMRDNFGVFIKRTGDQVQQIDTSLADFDALIMTQYQLVASIAEIPATKFLKTTPKGFNATGEFELKDYVQSLQSIQENDMTPLIHRHNELLTKSMLGKAIKFDVKFNPVDMPSEAEIAQVNNTNAQTISTLVNSGIISPDEARDRVRADESLGFASLAEELIEDDEEFKDNAEEKESH